MAHVVCLFDSPRKERDDMNKVFNQIRHERENQDAQWGGAVHDDTHDEQEWIGFMDEQLTKASDNGEYRERFVKIAALAVAALESMDRLGR